MTGLDEIFQLGFARLQRRGRRHCRGLHFAGDHGADGFRRPAGLDHGDIAFGIDAGAPQSDARSEIGLGAEAGRAGYFTAQIFDAIDIGLAEDPPIEFLRDGGNDHRIRARERGLNRCSPRRRLE